VLSTRAPIGYVAETTSETAFNQGCRGLVPVTEVELRFFRYQLLARRTDLVALGQGSTFTELSSDAVAAFKVARPSLLEQRKIADFLDAETARIDALIEKKRRMMSVLANREAAVMDRWATGCFARFGAMALRRRITTIEQGWSPQCQNVAAEPDEWGVLKTSAVTSGLFEPSKNKRLPDEIEPDLRWVVRDGDLLMTRGSGSLAFVGQAVVARVDSRHLMVSDLVYRVRLREQHPDFVAAILRSPQVRSLIEARVRSDAGLTLKLRVDDIKGLPIPAASVDEQVRSCEDLVAMLRPLSEARQAIERQIELLREHRQALITAAVTGQLDVARAAA
jgi:type I restriction enzyme S subunit